MAAVETSKIPLGYKAPDFSLKDTISGEVYTLQDLYSDKATVVAFICNHCPYVKHIFDGLVQMANDYQNKGVSFVVVSSNDVVNYPEDSPVKMKETALQYRFPFPYLYDVDQKVAKDYFAECTPDFSIFDGDLKCIYRGQMDNSRPGNGIPVTGTDIRDALDTVLQGRTVNPNQIPSLGCSIKWIPGK